MDASEKYPIYHITFPNQYLMASTFIRFQEHYESLEFRGRTFTLEEYMDWYAAKRGNFTYFEDWSGFNIPSTVLAPFYSGRFDPLTKKESALLDFFKQNMRGDFYIIGTIAGADDTIFHEIVHGLFFLFPSYRKEAIECIGRFDTARFRKHFLIKDGYNETVLDDEVNAYLTDGLEEKEMKFMDKPVHDRLHARLMALLKKHFGLRSKSACLKIIGSRIHTIGWQKIVAIHEKRLAS